MTRPQIIRADTHDLQAKSSPTAKDHSLQPAHPAPLGIGPAAPHQEAALRHVDQERSTEEANLQNAWSQAGSNLRADPGSDDEGAVTQTTNGQHHEEHAIRLEGDDGEMQDADTDDDMDDDMRDQISSSPSIDDEDIDFEFVYALHTFVATVEGQANATKGDTMVLLDDSNSYWWLVRVVKDSSIGYLPAEHIETPTERLARLNKHRNIDLSATMLGDTAISSKNPLKKAMRRRNAKTVQFAPPTYVEASDYDDYSSDDDGDGELFGGPEPKQIQQQAAESEEDDGLKVQPLKLGGGKKDPRPDDDSRSSTDSMKKERASDEGSDRPLDPKVSRNGTLRNTDSFFRDENTETRKITLTPNLLRDDSSTSTTGSRERGPSLESLEKNGFADKARDDKKKKEKKSGMLSGLFKRKDKKTKSDSVDSDIEKQLEEIDRTSPQPKPSEESTERPSPERVAPTPSRQSSKTKLQKAHRHRDGSPIKTKGILKTDSPMEAPDSDMMMDDPADGQNTQQTSTMRLVSPDQDSLRKPSVDERVLSPDHRSAQNNAGSKNLFSANQPQQNSNVGPVLVQTAKQRVRLDDFDSDDSSDPFADPEAQNKLARTETAESAGRLSESPVHISYPDNQEKAHVQDGERDRDPRQPPGLSIDTSSQETSSPVSTPTPDDSPTKSHPDKLSISTSITRGASPHLAPIDENSISMGNSPQLSSESTMLPAWSDACLRNYLDDGSEIRDMLVVIYDTTGVEPVGKEHPFMRSFLADEEKRLGALSGELDGLLSGLMGRGRKTGSVGREGSSASARSGR
ncbi:hypothetical protein P153DRAFT_369334 [Dothidotthia symphoricarpi CBS 119687]|uniref:SH3 domain-containing protein n=1 Tax=Dothidotthia symphoricarpi CBS 119687 TaxID=1392245 RepID=A0A6A6A6H0_9PLEO|nr:uncharacterized protein P153DRAFT_369334 [Dothidotthia symphoricarpi CBS 119687]KAF2126664.1 hypothetical protein P153DRAFT_369334 [Dothidotthia symphoricarpi CBS 119687]